MLRTAIFHNVVLTQTNNQCNERYFTSMAGIPLLFVTILHNSEITSILAVDGNPIVHFMFQSHSVMNLSLVYHKKRKQSVTFC